VNGEPENERDCCPPTRGNEREGWWVIGESKSLELIDFETARLIDFFSVRVPRFSGWWASDVGGQRSGGGLRCLLVGSDAQGRASDAHL